MEPGVQREDEFVRLFEEEAAVRLGRLSEQVPQLRLDGHQPDLVASIFRDAHSLRGAAAVVGLEPVQRVAHAMESLLEPVWRGQRLVTPWIVDAAQSGVNALKEIIPGVIAGEDVSARAAAAERSLGAVPIGREHQEPRSTAPSIGADVAVAEGPASVLVVDDAITVREVQRSILERAGYEVRTARDGIEALELLAERRADLIVVDIEMPRMDGYALMEAVRSEPSYADTALIVLTSRSGRRDRLRSVDAGADAFITKGSFDAGDFLNTVARLLGEKT
jgi:CheY-like chemotaxis protein/HPt (histidine-containing phosphotransfer) domain-containing protein